MRTAAIRTAPRALDPYLEWRGLQRGELDAQRYRVLADLEEVSAEAHHERENEPFDSERA